MCLCRNKNTVEPFPSCYRNLKHLHNPIMENGEISPVDKIIPVYTVLNLILLFIESVYTLIEIICWRIAVYGTLFILHIVFMYLW